MKNLISILCPYLRITTNNICGETVLGSHKVNKGMNDYIDNLLRKCIRDNDMHNRYSIYIIETLFSQNKFVIY